VNGETIVETPEDAVESFGHMDIDYLAIDDCWVCKDANLDNFPVLSDAHYLERRQGRYRASGVWPLAEYSLTGLQVAEQSVLKHHLKRVGRRVRQLLSAG
jgi:hypothetical protein